MYLRLTVKTAIEGKFQIVSIPVFRGPVKMIRSLDRGTCLVELEDGKELEVQGGITNIERRYAKSVTVDSSDVSDEESEQVEN
jgi:hypothetical protein